MSGQRERYTVAFDPDIVATIKDVAAHTHLGEITDFIRSAVEVNIDLLDVSGRRLKIIFRDDATGREWEYSPLLPGRATPIGESKPDNVYRPAFGRQRRDDLIVGKRAFTGVSAESALAADVVALPAETDRSIAASEADGGSGFDAPSTRKRGRGP